MARYIDCENCYHGKVCAERHIYHDMIVSCPHHIPTADVVEVKHGEWKEERWCDNFQHTCSLCHSTVRVHPQSVAYKYCPNCGAKMDGGKTE